MKLFQVLATALMFASFSSQSMAFSSLEAKEFYYSPGKDQMKSGEDSSIWVKVCNSGNDASEPTYLTLDLSHFGITKDSYFLNVSAIAGNSCGWSDGVNYVFDASGLWGIRASGDSIMWTFEPIYIN